MISIKEISTLGGVGLVEQQQQCLAKEEIVGHEHEESSFVRLELDHHVRLDPPTHYLEFSSRERQKNSANVAREMDFFTINQLIHVPLEIQHDTIGKFLSHSLLKDMVPPYLTNLRVEKHKYDVLQNMKEGINTHLVGWRKSKLIMVCTLTSS